MSEQSRRLSIYVNLDTGQLERSSEQAKNTLKGIGNEAEAQGKRMASVFKNAGVAIVAAFAVQRIKSFISEIINVRSEIQSLSVSFETLLGNKQKADALMAQIRTYAANTPMQMNDLAQGAQTLLGFNVEAKKVMPILRSIGDISMGDAMRFNSLTLAFAQMSATGKLMGQDLLQMINAGFNPLMIISEKTGKAMSTLKDEMSAGSISAQMVEDAFRAATAEGGKFHGMLEAQSKTLRGSLSNLRGAFADMLNDFGESSEGLIAGGVNAAYQMVKNYKETAEALMALIATIGVYKAAIIANEAIEAAAIDTLHAKMASRAEVQAAQATGLELEVQQAVAKGVLAKADAEEILANFELAKARVADLNALKIHTQAEEKAAIVARNLAAANVQAAEAQVTAANMKYEAALRSGNGEKIERAELALGTAQSELNAASKAHQAALTDVATASKKASAAATAADTAQQELNTISLQNNSKATGFLTLAKTQLRGTVAKLYATMTAHPLAILLAAVVALGYGIYKLCTYETDAEKAQKRLNESFAEAQAAAATERMEIDRLFDKLKKAKEGTEAYKKAKEDIWSKYGNYLKALGDENTALKDQAAAYALVAKKAREAAMAKYKAEWMDKEGKATQDKLTNTYKKVKELITEKYGEDYYLRHAAEFARIIRGDTDVNPEFLKAFNKVTEHTSYHRSTGTYTTWTTTSNKLADYIADGKKAMSEFNDMVTEAEALFGAAKDPGDGATDPEDTKLYNTELKQAKATMDKAKKEWQNLKKSTTATVKQVQDAEKAYESAKKRYEELSGKKNEDKGKTEAEKVADRAAALRKETDLTIDQIRERREAILKYEAELEQARIDILEDGAEKRLRQRELDMANDIADLRSRMQQEIDNEVARQKAAFDAQEEANAAGKKHYAKKTFDSGDILALEVNPGKSIAADANTGNVDTKAINQIIALYGVLNNLLLRKHKKRINDEQTAERLAMDEYLRQYGTMQEKREAIDRIYADRKSKATSQGEAMQIQQEWNAALNDIEFDDFVQNRAALAFGEVENLSNATIGELIDELEKYRSKVVATFDPEKISKYEEALSRLKKAQAMNADNPLSAFIPEYFKEKKAAQAELNAAEKVSNDLAAEKLKKEKELSGKVNEIIAKTKELAGIELTVAQVKNGAALQKVIDGFISKALKTDNDDEKTRFNAIAKTLEGLQIDLGNATVGLNNVATASNAADKNLKQLSETFKAKFTGENGVFSSIVSAVGFLDQTMQGIGQSISMIKGAAEALGADVSEGSSWDKIETLTNTLLGFSSGMSQIVQSATSGNIGGMLSGVTGIFTGFISGFAALHDKSRERTIQRLQEQVDELDRINRRIDRQAGKQYSREAADSYERMMANNRRQIDLIQQQIDAERDKKKTDDDRIQEWEDQIEELRNQIEDYKDAAIDAIIGEDISTSIDNFAEKMADSWGNTKQAARDARQYVKDMLRQMVIEAMKTDLSDPVRRLRDMMSRAMSDGVVTDAEQKGMEDFAKKMAEDMQRRYDWASDILDTAESGQNGGERGGFATASQDSVNELNGRFAAMHTSIEMARQSLGTIQIDTSGIRAQLAEQNRIAQEARSMHVTAIGHLEAISKNTKQLYEMNERLAQIEKNTKGL